MRRLQDDPIPLAELFPYAALTGALGFLPLPFVDEYANAQVRGAMLNHVADRHGLTLDPYARERLSRGYGHTAGVVRRVGTKAVGLVFRRVFALVNASVAADDAAQTLILGYLFDRYCGKMHNAADGRTVVGEMIAIRIRGALDSAVMRASRTARRDLLRQSLGRGLGTLRDIPQGVLESMKQLARRRPLSAERMVDQLIEDERGYFGRVTERASLAINGVGNAYLERVREAFDVAMDFRATEARKPVRKKAATSKRKKSAPHTNGVHTKARRDTRPSA